jgi:hypothetical protein
LLQNGTDVTENGLTTALDQSGTAGTDALGQSRAEQDVDLPTTIKYDWDQRKFIGNNGLWVPAKKGLYGG